MQLLASILTVWTLAQEAGAASASVETAIISVLASSPVAAVAFYGWNSATKRADRIEAKHDRLVERLFSIVEELAPLTSESNNTLHEVQAALTEAAKVASQRAAAEGTERQLDELIRRIKGALEGESR